MKKNALSAAIQKLQDEFPQLDFTYHDSPTGNPNEKLYKWPGPADEDILVCVHKSNGEQELFHRHEFFYFNYTYKGQYDSLSFKYDNQITIHEGELYAGQPYAGHALCVHDNQETIIIGVLIRREAFFRSFLPMLSSSPKLFRFFLDPNTNHFSEEFIHMKIHADRYVRPYLEMMILEYANKKEDTQDILKPLTLTYLMQIARQYVVSQQESVPERVSERIVQYMSEHCDSVSLQSISKVFAYHPNYISTLIRKELGKSFSEILLDLRMNRAAILLKGTNLPIEEISLMLGYSNSSNFHKAFKQYYHCSPRKYSQKNSD